MGTKNQNMAVKKKQRAKARKVKDGNKHSGMSTARLVKEISQHGVRETANKHYDVLRKEIKNNKIPDRMEIYKTLFKIIGDVAPIHSIMEVMETLKEEHGTINYLKDTPELIDKCDELIVKIAEDCTAIRILLEEGQNFEDFSEVFISLLENSTEFLTNHAKRLFDEVMMPNQEAIETYIKEHSEPDEERLAFSFRMHEQRMDKVQDLYRTVVIPVIPAVSADGVPQEFIPVEEVCPEDYDELKDIN